MDCPKGSVCTESTHEVKTLAKALEWYSGCKETDLPITVNTLRGEGGRMLVSISSQNKLIHKRG